MSTSPVTVSELLQKKKQLEELLKFFSISDSIVCEILADVRVQCAMPAIEEYTFTSKKVKWLIERFVWGDTHTYSCQPPHDLRGDELYELMEAADHFSRLGFPVHFGQWRDGPIKYWDALTVISASRLTKQQKIACMIAIVDQK